MMNRLTAVVASVLDRVGPVAGPVLGDAHLWFDFNGTPRFDCWREPDRAGHSIHVQAGRWELVYSTPKAVRAYSTPKAVRSAE